MDINSTMSKSNQADGWVIKLEEGVHPGLDRTNTTFGVTPTCGSVFPGPSLEGSPPGTVKDDAGEPDFVTVTWPHKLLGREIPMFYGKSSGHYFTRDAVHLKKEIEGHVGDHLASDFVFNSPRRKRHEFWIPQPVRT
jgi:hypothetical protein